MNDYKTALREYQELKYIIDTQLEDMAFLSNKFNSFKSGLQIIEENINFSLGNNSDEFNYINPIFSNYIQEIHKECLTYNEQIIIPLKNFVESFNFATKNSLNSFNKIKTTLIESKQKVIKAKEDYYNYIKENKDNQIKGDDQNELYNAKKQNYSQLYKYEINKMNEIITQNNKNYEDIFKTLDSINISSNSFIKNLLTRFSKIISNIANIFIKFSEQFNEGLNENLENIQNNQRYISKIDEKTKMRFKFEVFEEYDENKEKEEKK